MNSGPDTSDNVRSQIEGQAIQMFKLMAEIDLHLNHMASSNPLSKPWQRSLHAGVMEANRCMEILRLTEAMQKSDQEIIAAVIALDDACKKLNLSIRGSRADSGTKLKASVIARSSGAIVSIVRRAAAALNVPLK